MSHTDTSYQPAPCRAADRAVGANLRRLRLAKGVTQEALATAMGVSFQQVQKYEKGANRMGASRLLQAAGALDVPVLALFAGVTLDGRPACAGTTPPRPDVATERATARLVALPPPVREGVYTLIGHLARHTGTDPEPPATAAAAE